MRRIVPGIFFIIICSNLAAAPVRPVVFNAKNGFRLWDDAPENPADHIRFAVAKLERKNPMYLSIVSVRNIGISRTMEPQIEALVISLERKQIRTPEIQLLERERLEKVTDERSLTGKRFALIPSVRLLTFEFEQGGDNAGINVKILIRNIGGKMLCGAYTTPGAILPDDVKKSPLLLLPGCAHVFGTEEGVLYLGQNRYFFVREKNQPVSERWPKI